MTSGVLVELLWLPMAAIEGQRRIVWEAPGWRLVSERRVLGSVVKQGDSLYACPPGRTLEDCMHVFVFAYRTVAFVPERRSAHGGDSMGQ